MMDKIVKYVSLGVACLFCIIGIIIDGQQPVRYANDNVSETQKQNTSVGNTNSSNKEDSVSTGNFSGDKQSVETINQTEAKQKEIKDVDLADYLDDFSEFVKIYPDYVMEMRQDCYFDITGNLTVQCDSFDEPQYIDIAGDKDDDIPMLYSLKVGTKENTIEKNMPSDYKLAMHDEYGGVYYNDKDGSQIITFIDTASNKVERIVYLTEEGYQNYWLPNIQQSDNSWEYILPDSDKYVYSASELSGLSSDDVQMAINEIYARHGRKFDTPYIQEYFNSKSWYAGTVNPSDFSESVLSDIEKANIKTLTDLRAHMAN